MKALRAIAVWLGAPLLASVFCTTAWNFATGGQLFSGSRILLAAYSISLLFAIAGSTLLSLAFASMRPLRIPGRYLALVAFGAVAGGAMMLPFGTHPNVTVPGVVYGTVTACIWVGLHRSVYGSR
jgi:hypothetical protein